MKKFILLLVAAVAALPCPGSEPGKNVRKIDVTDPSGPFRYEVRVGWGGYPLFDDIYLNPYNEDVGIYYGYGDRPLTSLYDDYSGPVYMTGVISAEFCFILKKWLTLSVGLNFNGIWGNTYDGETSAFLRRDSGISMTLLPQVRFTYKTGRYFKLYSAVGLGVTYGTFRDKRIVSPCLHLVPFGLTAGRKVYGFAEMGVGMLITGYNVGVGVRF